MNNKHFPKEELKMAKLETSKPIRIKAARGVHAKLWKNRNQHGEWYNVTISRVYKDGEIPQNYVLGSCESRVWKMF